jgi:hypothetical protein
MENGDRIIVIYSGSPINAELLKGILLEEGITAALQNELIGSIAPWQLSAGGFNPVDVVVFERDKEKALALIEEFNGIG